MLAIAAGLILASASGQAATSSPGPGEGAAGHCRTIASRTQGLDQSYRSGVFQIRFAVSGADAIGERKDVNGNGIPDVIDDLGQQLVTANDYYVKVLGLEPPLSQPRYRQAREIEVLVKNTRRQTGLSFDEVVREPGQTGCKLMIIVSAHLEFNHNPTAAHELFHLFQYGYTMFKVPWYLEGMARWVEGIFAEPRNPGWNTLRSPVRCQAVWKESYAASRFWQSMALSAPPVAHAPMDRRLEESRYVDGSRVIADAHFPGSIIQAVLRRLQKASLQLSEDPLSPFEWPESVQKSHRFDRDLCQSIAMALKVR